MAFLEGQISGAGDGIRTRDIDLGKVALYQLSYSRPTETPFSRGNIPRVKWSCMYHLISTKCDRYIPVENSFRCAMLLFGSRRSHPALLCSSDVSGGRLRGLLRPALEI